MGELPELVDREVDVLRRSLDGLRGDLPRDWRWRVEEHAKRADRRFDAIVTLTAPDGQQATLVVEAKRLIRGFEVASLVEQLRSGAAMLPGAVPLVVARFLPPSTRERLERDGVSYADATGNRRLALERPAVFVRNVGESRDPWRGPGRPRGTLIGAPAAHVVRWLADFSPPYTVLEVAKSSGTSTGATYRVIAFLEEEGLVTRGPRGRIEDVQWRALLERWSRDYQFQGGATESLLFPRDIEALVDTLRGAGDVDYVLTGSLAARDLAPYAPPRLAMLYATDVDQTTDRLGLRAVDTGANVLVARDREGVAFLRPRLQNRVRLAAPSQVAVDLLTGPGRSPSEGEALLAWMEAHEPAWRK